MAKTPSSRLVDQLLRHATLVERFAESEGARMIELLDTTSLADLEALVIRRMRMVTRRGPEAVADLRVLTDLRVAIRSRITDSLRFVERDLAANMGRFARAEGEFALRALRAVGGERTMRRATKRALNAVVKRDFLGSPLEGWFRDLSARAQTKVVREIRQGIAFGEDVESIAARLRGPLKATENGARTIARTAVKHVSSQAQREVWLANPGIVDRETFSAVLDSATSATCASLDGNVYAVGVGPVPPLHMQCRSNRLPVLVGEELPDRQTYGEWLAGQDEATQQEVLGAGGAKLFRSGKLTISEFADARGKPLTLAELLEKEGLTRKDLALL